MSRRLEELLFRGETIKGEVQLERAHVAVTTHRVLALTPDSDGKEFDHADRPNVVGATVATSGDPNYRNWTARGTLYGFGLLSGGYVIDRSDLFGVFSGTGTATEGVPGVGFIETLVSVLGMLSLALLLLGVVALCVSIALLGLYATSRERELVIDLKGRDPIRVPVDEDEGERAVAMLRGAL